MQTGFNLRTAAWVLAAFWALSRWRVSLSFTWAAYGDIRRDVGTLATAGAIALMGTAPLVVNGFRLWWSGNYVTQEYFWRSTPKGIDLASLVLGSPLHPVWGPVMAQVHAGLNLDAIEQVAWLGIWPSLLLILARKQLGTLREARRWATIGLVFLLWALGPFLNIGGVNTGLVLPQTLIRFVPLAANARIPGRAMILVYLVLAMLVAMALTSLRIRSFKFVGGLVPCV